MYTTAADVDLDHDLTGTDFLPLIEKNNNPATTFFIPVNKARDVAWLGAPIKQQPVTNRHMSFIHNLWKIMLISFRIYNGNI